MHQQLELRTSKSQCETNTMKRTTCDNKIREEKQFWLYTDSRGSTACWLAWETDDGEQKRQKKKI